MVNFEWQIQFQVKDRSLQTLPQPERGQNLFEAAVGFVPGNREVKVPLEVVGYRATQFVLLVLFH